MKKSYAYSLNEIAQIAQQILTDAQGRKIWTFVGDLGAGKTTLIKELAHQLGVEDDVTSPTYTIVNEYVYLDGSIFHIDAYRLKDEAEAYDIGIEDILDSGDYVWIEWPQIIENFLPEEVVNIHINIAEQGRKLELEVI